MVLFLMVARLYGQNGKVSPECTPEVTREVVAIPPHVHAASCLLCTCSSWLSARADWLLVTGSWLLAPGYWTLYTGFWTLYTGFWTLYTGYWILDTGYWILGTGDLLQRPATAAMRSPGTVSSLLRARAGVLQRAVAVAVPVPGMY